MEFKREHAPPILSAHPFPSLFSNLVFPTGNATRPYAESIRASRAWVATGLAEACAASGSMVRDHSLQINPTADFAARSRISPVTSTVFASPTADCHTRVVPAAGYDYFISGNEAAVD